MKLLIVTQKVDTNDQLLGFFVAWIKRFSAKFDSVLVVCLQKGTYDLPANVRVVDLGKDRGLSKVVWVWNFYRTIIGMSDQYDTVLVHMNPIWMVLGGLIWILMGKFRGLWYTHKTVTFKLKLAEKFSQKIFTASKESFRLPSKKVIVTGHGIDTELFKPNLLSTNHYPLTTILSVGRIAPVKNYGVLIEAANILKEQGLSFHISMVGEPALPSDQEYMQKLKAQIHVLGLDQTFTFTGKVGIHQLSSIYQSHQLFVHLSRTGSVDKVLLEAMASGMQVVSCNDSARSFLPSILLFGDNDPAQLANKIKSLVNQPVDPALRQYVVEHHNLDRLIERLFRELAYPLV